MPRIPAQLVQLLARPPTLARLPSLVSSFLPRAPTPFHPLSPSRSTLFTSLFRLAPPTTSPILALVQQTRSGARGTEYQPSQRKRKRKHGFLARKRSASGRKILARRMAKKRSFLSH